MEFVLEWNLWSFQWKWLFAHYTLSVTLDCLRLLNILWYLIDFFTVMWWNVTLGFNHMKKSAKNHNFISVSNHSQCSNVCVDNEVAPYFFCLFCQSAFIAVWEKTMVSITLRNSIPQCLQSKWSYMIENENSHPWVSPPVKRRCCVPSHRKNVLNMQWEMANLKIFYLMRI